MRALLAAGVASLAVIATVAILLMRLQDAAEQVATLQGQLDRAVEENESLSAEREAERRAWQANLQAMREAQERAAYNQERLAKALKGLGDTNAELDACLRRNLSTPIIERLPK